MDHLYWLVPLLVLLAGLTYVFWLIGRRANPVTKFNAARERFTIERDHLHAQFFRVAAASGKPRGLRWKECQWSEAIEWLRDKQSGDLLALVGVTIAFEAIEGGDMEGVAAVGNLRNASAVFHFKSGKWDATGRVVFNLNPDEAVEHFKAGYDRISASPLG